MSEGFSSLLPNLFVFVFAPRTFGEHVEFEVDILAVLVQMINYYKRACLQRTSSLGILKGSLGRSVGLHYKRCYENYDNEGGDSHDDVLIQIMIGTKNGRIAVGVIEIGNDVRQ